MLQRICSLLRIRPPLTENEGLLSGSGGSVPSDGSQGWQTGAFFQKTSGEDGSVLFVNLGSVGASMFRQVLLYDPE